jgi:nicotinamidase-related amidase
MSEPEHNVPCRPALLVIDVQRALFEKSTPIYKADDLLAHITLLADRAHQAGVPVVYVRHTNASFLAEGCDGWQLHPSLHPDPADLILQKRHGSALQDTPLHPDLQSRGVNTLVVTGLVTHGCVKATCQDANAHGYRVILVEDGHSSYHKDAARLVETWNRQLSEEGIELCAAQTMDFTRL